jgi:hypothetical protein
MDLVVAWVLHPDHPQLGFIDQLDGVEVQQAHDPRPEPTELIEDRSVIGRRTVWVGDVDQGANPDRHRDIRPGPVRFALEPPENDGSVDRGGLGAPYTMIRRGSPGLTRGPARPSR